MDWFLSSLLPFYKVFLFIWQESISLVPSEYNLSQILTHWLPVLSGRPQNDTGQLSEVQTKKISSVEGMQIFYSDNLQSHCWWLLKPRGEARAGCFLTPMKIKRANMSKLSFFTPQIGDSNSIMLSANIYTNYYKLASFLETLSPGFSKDLDSMLSEC